MSRSWRRVFAGLAGVWLLVAAGVAAAFGSRVFGALLTGGGLASVLGAMVVFALLFGYLGYRFGTEKLLSRLGAVPLSAARAPGLHASLDRLVGRMNVERPDVYVVSLGQPNAFALGSDALVVERSLVSLLGPAELEAILAHELAHLEGHDGLIQTLAASLLRSLTSLALVVLVPGVVVISMAGWGLSLLLGRPVRGPESVGSGLRRALTRAVTGLAIAPTAALRAYSRRREYAADDRAVAVIHDPLALARALSAIQRATEAPRGFFGWVLPEPERERTPFERVFASHPPTDDRIERVREAVPPAGPDRRSGGWRRIEIN